MKAYTVVISAILFAATAAGTRAQEVETVGTCKEYLSSLGSYQGAYMAKAVRNYTRCLESPNAGVVESALAHVGKMILILPDANCKELVKRIDVLMVKGETPAIRYKAYLTRMVYDNPKMFEPEGRMDFKEDDELFSAVARRLQHTLLGYDGR